MRFEYNDMYGSDIAVDFEDIYDYNELLNYDIYANAEKVDFEFIEEQERFFNFIAEELDIEFDSFYVNVNFNEYVNAYIANIEGQYIQVEGYVVDRAEFFFSLQPDIYINYALKLIKEKFNMFIRKLIEDKTRFIGGIAFSVVEK